MTTVPRGYPKDRGTGRTTEQMEAAPKGAVFVWVNSYLSYPKHLAVSLGRQDLLIFRLCGLKSLVFTWAEIRPA